MNKIYMSLGIMLMLSIGMVSAATISNLVTNYDKKTNQITVDYDITLNKECLWTPLWIKDHKGNIIATNIDPVIPGNAIPIRCIIYKGTAYSFFSKTGTFHRSYVLDAIDKNLIKGLGKLTYEIRHHSGLLAEGKL